MESEKEAVLIHICCAPCATASVEKLIQSGYEPIMYFSNSNIQPEDEFLKRLRQAERLASVLGVGLHIDEYDHPRWLEAVRGFETEPEGGSRCSKCFRFSLGRTAKKAEELLINRFTTSLTVSPHKNSAQVFAAGEEVSALYLEERGMKIDFLPCDFKKENGFQRSIKLSTELDLYRQNYCGCEFSRKA